MTVMLTDLHSLPICPSASTLRSLPPSQQTTILDHISSALFHALSLPDEKLSKLLCNDFIASYARQEAIRALNDLVFSVESPETERRPAQEKVIRRRVLSLALRLSGLPGAGGLGMRTILDICLVYGLKNSTKVTEVVEKAMVSNPMLLQEIQHSVVPAFASVLLSADSGLHALQKTAFCLKCLVKCSPPAVIDEFLKDNEFILALAKCYDGRLSVIAAGYGGINIDRPEDTGTAMLWVGCKAALIDCFHVFLEHILKAVRDDPRTNSERAFDLVFALLNIPSASEQSSVPRTPFLNRPLLADYQDAYGLLSALASVLSNNDDPRLDVLEATLKSYESKANTGDTCGALKIVLHLNGVPPGIDYRGLGRSKGKERAVPEPEQASNADLDTSVSRVLDILPDQEPAYIRSLLSLPQYDGNTERIVAALLEGDAPPPSSLKPEVVQVAKPQTPTPERRNIFNEQRMEVASVQIGKRRGDADAVLQDRAFLDQMKADILRRAAELSDSDDEKEVADMDDVDDLASVLDPGIKVVADREDIEGETDAEDAEDEDEGKADAPPQTPETICELAYIKDPKVFDRDADTRRSKGRAELKARTGWSDEQIEGWRIMLERNPKKDKVLQKHEFSGNKRGPIPGFTPDQAIELHRGGRGRGRGSRGPGRGHGRGGGRGGGGGSDNSDARERAWKDKNKARQANHNRKRGHDRKMARGGAIPGPST